MSPTEQVRIQTPRGVTAVGQVVSELSTGNASSGPQTMLVVDVDGSRYRVPEAAAESI
jgi:hypothetical protein